MKTVNRTGTKAVGNQGMTRTTRWWWIRHAPVTVDGGFVYGQRDVPADISNRAGFTALAGLLPAGAIWITSNLQRTKQTAAAIAAAGHAMAPAVEEPDLAEQNFGDWQGRPRAEVYRRNRDWRGFWLAPADRVPPGGESFDQLFARVAPVIERLTASHAGRDIVAVAHGGTIRAALALALDLAPAAALAFATENLSVTRLDHIGGPAGSAWRINGVNMPPH